MKIKEFVRLKNGNTSVIVTNKRLEDVYVIGRNADNLQPYGICKPNTDVFISITKCEGKKIYSKVLAEIEKNKSIPVLDEHIFSPDASNGDFCKHCGRYFTDHTHTRTKP